jgi:hypothetical protein
MSIITRHLGDDDGHGHELRVLHQDDGIVVLLSLNPDTSEVQRIVLMESQWRRLLCTLLDVHGKEKCCYFKAEGICGPDAQFG